MDNTVDKKRFNRIFRPFKNKMNELITKDKAEFSNSFSITNGENDLSFSPIDNGLELSTNNANNKMIISNDGKITINGVNIERNKKNIDYDESIKYKDIGLIMVEEGYTKNKDIPYIFYGGSAVAIGTDIYLLGSSNNSYYKYNYKYDTTTNTYTQNSDIPYTFDNGTGVAIGTDIYLFGNGHFPNTNSRSDYNYKYDTITDTYSKNENIPYSFGHGTGVAIGNDIYLLGSYISSYSHYNYKYDTITNTYSRNSDIPYIFSYASTVAIKNDIYLLGSSSPSDGTYRNYNYKYNITTNTYTKNKNIPYDFYNGSAVAIENDIYILGGGGGDNSYSNNYKYDTTTNTYTQNTDIPYKYKGLSAVSIGNNIYLLDSGYEIGDVNYLYAKYNYKYTPKHAETTKEYIGVIKPSNHSIYTSKNKSYTDTKAKFVPIDDNEYYTEYSGNNIVKNTYDIDINGNTKIYYKKGARINNKLIDSDTEGIIDINILNYL